MKRISVLWADDHMIVREGLRKILDVEPDLEVVAEAQTGRQAVEMVRKLRPEVVVMDIAMPLLNGVEATKQILQAVPATRVLILSAHSDDAYIEQLTAIGVAGYLIKQTSAHVLAKAIRDVHKGGSFFSPSIAKRFRDPFPKAVAGGKPENKKVTHLTSRELEVLQLIAEGKANKETAFELGIGIKTVEKHREHLMEKLDIHDVAGLTRYAIGAGIVESGVHLKIV